MSRISLDVNQSPVRIGGLIIGKYVVTKGAKGLKVDNTAGVKEAELVEALKDASRVVKSFFGVPNFDAAVVVVPNYTNPKILDDISRYGQKSGFNIAQVIEERLAVAVAYVEKAKPTIKTKLAIISESGDIVDVNIIQIKHDSDANASGFAYALHGHKSFPQPIDHEKREGGGHSDGGISSFVGNVVKTVLVDPLQKTVNALKDLLGGLNFNDGNPSMNKVVVFVGKATRSEQLLKAVKEAFPGSDIWSGFDDAFEIAAYGAAVLSQRDIKIRLETLIQTGDAGFNGGM